MCYVSIYDSWCVFKTVSDESYVQIAAGPTFCGSICFGGDQTPACACDLGLTLAMSIYIAVHIGRVECSVLGYAICMLRG